jgi:hypothetical protein
VGDVVPGALQHLDQDAAEPGLVIDNQDPRHGLPREDDRAPNRSLTGVPDGTRGRFESRISLQSHARGLAPRLLFSEEIAKEAAMCSKWTRDVLLIAILVAAPAAWAGGSPPATKGGADPAAKTLPASASDTAKANAFGQKGATHSQAGGHDPSSAKGGADPATKTLPASASDTA